MDNALKKKLITVGIAIALAAGAWYTWQKYKGGKDDGALLHGNGRIEATEVDVATKLAGRVDNILVSEGAFVKAGQVLATMQVQTLNAQLREAKAQRQQTLAAVASAQAQVVMRQSDKTAQLARMRQAEAEFDAAKRRLARSETLTKEGAASVQTLDDDRARARSAEAAIASVQAQADSADAAVAAARMQVTSAQSQVQAIDATLERIQAEIDDSQLKAPRDGRVQFRLAQPSEVLGAGGKVLNLVDLSDVYKIGRASCRERVSAPV